MVKDLSNKNTFSLKDQLIKTRWKIFEDNQFMSKLTLRRIILSMYTLQFDLIKS